MSKQKQSRVEGLEKKVEALIRVVKQILDENAYLKDLSVGTLETYGDGIYDDVSPFITR